MWSASFSSSTASLRPSTRPPPVSAAVVDGLERLNNLLYPIIQASIQDGGAAEDELREIAMDAEDVLDEWDYEQLRAKVEAGGGGAAPKRKLADILADDPALPGWMADEIGRIMERYREIAADSKALLLKEVDGARRRRHSDQLPSSSLVDGRYVYDRDEYKDALIDYLLSHDGSGLTVIPIVGMVGKTTLAQLVYSDPRIEKHFKRRGWVSLTGNSDPMSLLRGVVESLTGKPCRSGQLDTIQSVLRQFVMERKLLLVLDDVRREGLVFWDMLKASICSASQGSAVFITTKAVEVAEGTKTVVEPVYLSEKISDDSCWLLFKRYAFDDGQHTVQGLDMAGIRDKVVDICEGMPSVAKFLGGYFRKRLPREEWMDLMENVVKEEIVPALWSSYQALPAYLKPCLLYCSLFPKGYSFTKDELVRLWMAQGLVRPRNREQPEDTGIRYFDEFLSRSFFLPSEMNVEEYCMPNLICDLLYSISTNRHSRAECIAFLPQKARHLPLACKSMIQCESFYKYRGLRSFLVMRPFPYTSIMHLEIQDKMFRELNCLRSLDLSYTCIHTLPDSVGCLKHLRFLALNHTKIEMLPESIHKLYNLQTLELKRCSCLKELPRGISSLINLRHLDVDSDYLLVHMPFQIRRLTSL